MKSKLLFIFICLFGTGIINAQKTLGILGSNYAGISNIDLNPSLMSGSKLSWEFNLLSVDGNFFNNSFYVNPTNVFTLLSKPNLKVEYANTLDREKFESADIIINPSIVDQTFFNLNVNVKGPSFMLNLGKHSFAISSGLRVESSAFNLPKSIVLLGYEDFAYPDIYNQTLSIKKGTILASMSWAEIGGSYSKKVINNSDLMVSAGASLKMLFGFDALFALSNGMDYYVPYESNFTAQNVNMETAQIIRDKNAGLSIVGTGVSTDFGVTIFRKASSRKNDFLKCPIVSKKQIDKDDYRWKLGFSLVDVGGINFNKNAIHNRYKNVQYTWDSFSKVGFTDLDRVGNVIFDSVKKASPVEVNGSFMMYCPTAISVQFDYNFNHYLYLNATLIQRIVFSNTYRLERMNSIILTPRFERRYVELSVPLVLSEYAYFNWGVMLRLKSFFVGTDMLNSTLGLTRLNGLSIYAGLKFNKVPDIFSTKNRYRSRYMKNKKFSLF